MTPYVVVHYKEKHLIITELMSKKEKICTPKIGLATPLLFIMPEEHASVMLVIL